MRISQTVNQYSEVQLVRATPSVVEQILIFLNRAKPHTIKKFPPVIFQSPDDFDSFRSSRLTQSLTPGGHIVEWLDFEPTRKRLGHIKSNFRNKLEKNFTYVVLMVRTTELFCKGNPVEKCPFLYTLYIAYFVLSVSCNHRSGEVFYQEHS